MNIKHVGSFSYYGLFWLFPQPPNLLMMGRVTLISSCSTCETLRRQQCNFIRPHIKQGHVYILFNWTLNMKITCKRPSPNQSPNSPPTYLTVYQNYHNINIPIKRYSLIFDSIVICLFSHNFPDGSYI